MKHGGFDLAVRVLAVLLILGCGGHILLRALREPGGVLALPAERPDMAAVTVLPAGVPPGPWQRIIIHHSGTTGSSYEEIKIALGKLGYNEVPFHFLVRPEGAVRVTWSWQQQVQCPSTPDADTNRQAIAICVIGDFAQLEERPAPAQMESLVRLVTTIMRTYGIRQRYVWRGADDSPGAQFPWNSFLKQLPKDTGT